MYRRKYGFRKRKRGYQRYNQYKSKFGRFSRGGKYRRVYKTFRRYKKFKRSGFRQAQRRYQITKYRIPNVSISDELVMTFKWRAAMNTEINGDRIVVPAFGFDPFFFDQVTGWKENAENYNMVEFLSCKASAMYYNTSKVYHYTKDGTSPTQSGSISEYPAFIGMITQRRWEDQDKNQRTEVIPDPPSTATQFYQATAEYPGYKMKVVSGISSGKYCKGFKTKFSHNSWKNLKAKNTGFQVGLPIAKPQNPGGSYVPVNSAAMVFDYQPLANDIVASTGFNAKTVSKPMVLVTYKFTVRFKGKQLVAPV